MAKSEAKKNQPESKFKYFSCVKGVVVQRFGTDTFIGVRKTSKGWVWNEERVIRLPENEVTRYIREYNNAIKAEALVERTEKDFDDYWKKVEEEAEKNAKSSKAGKSGGGKKKKPTSGTKNEE